ncbi:MAG: DegT/DnrJ/EryC1/StrS family aminotransferase [Endomicrobiales bacterium]|nr:DegT/DnrJ/EryC1/StrS family aminotransferase [Endomicrobiales bacterium]
MIPVFKPCMDDREVEAVTEVLKSGWIGLGPKTGEFEDKFAKYIGVKYAVGVNSATAALHLGMMVLGLEGSEVITTPMTFISTNHAILYNGAVPVFCDIEEDSLNIDASKIEALVTKKTKAIVVVHYGGYSVDMDKVNSVAKKHDLKVIEDAAHGCGGEYRGRKLGSLADIGCFSFHAVKNLSTGEGGMITTNDEALYKKLIKLRWMGITKDTWSRGSEDSKGYSWYYNVEGVGYKYHMSDIAASLGIVQLGKIDVTNSKRKEISERYSKAFLGAGGIEVPKAKEYMSKPSCHNYVIKIGKRDELNKFLKDRGISSSVHYIPNNHYDMYKSCRGKTPVCDTVWKRILTLPLYPDLKDEEIKLIIDSVLEFQK